MLIISGLQNKQGVVKVDEKATIRNRYNQIPHPALDIKWERNTYNLDGIK